MISDPHFKVKSLFDDEYLRNGTRYIHIYNGILIWTYTRPYSIELSFRMTSSDIKRHLVIRRIARSVCDNWVSCSMCQRAVYLHNITVNAEGRRALSTTVRSRPTGPPYDGPIFGSQRVLDLRSQFTLTPPQSKVKSRCICIAHRRVTPQMRYRFP